MGCLFHRPGDGSQKPLEVSLQVFHLNGETEAKSRQPMVRSKGKATAFSILLYQTCVPLVEMPSDPDVLVVGGDLASLMDYSQHVSFHPSQHHHDVIHPIFQMRKLRLGMTSP